MQILLGSNTDLDLRQAVEEAGKLQPITVSQESRTAAHEFITRRLEQLLVDNNVAIEVARAVLHERANNPVLAHKSAQELQVSFFPLEKNALKLGVNSQEYIH